MTSAITNPLHLPEMEAVKGADVVMAHDRSCKAWIKSCKTWEQRRAAEQSSAAVNASVAAPVEEPAEGPKVSRRMMRKLRSAS
jgi:5-methyltetrahydrofolate--homocysteine methyltransferase